MISTLDPYQYDPEMFELDSPMPSDPPELQPTILSDGIEGSVHELPEATIDYGKLSLLEQFAELEKTIEVFQDQYRKVYAKVPRDNPTRYQTVPIHSRKFVHVLWILTDRKISKTNLRLIIEIFQEKAEYEQRVFALESRFCTQGNASLTDLCNEKGQMAVVTSGGCMLITELSPTFRRFDHQLSLPTPVIPNSIELTELYDWLGLQDSKEKFLILTWLLSAIEPSVESPILAIIGPAGSGKSTLCRKLRWLIDPSNCLEIGNVNASTLPQILNDHAVPLLENISNFSRSVADQLCRAVTNGSLYQRKLFSDDESVFKRVQRPILLNGVDMPSLRPDFLDRVIQVNMTRRSEFSPSDDIQKLNTDKHARMLGTLLLLQAKTKANFEQVKSDSIFRMASFVKFGRAVALSHGLPESDFDNAYRENQTNQAKDIIETDLPSRLIAELAGKYTVQMPWTGTLTDLSNQLSKSSLLAEYAGKEGLVKPVAKLGKMLLESAPTFELNGISVTKLPRTNSARNWKIYSFPPAAAATNEVTK